MLKIIQKIDQKTHYKLQGRFWPEFYMLVSEKTWKLWTGSMAIKTLKAGLKTIKKFQQANVTANTYVANDSTQ